MIINISLGKILLSYIANTSRTHARMHERTHSLTLAHMHPPTHHRRSVGAPNHDRVIVGYPLFDAGETMAGRWFIEINNAWATLYSR